MSKLICNVIKKRYRFRRYLPDGTPTVEFVIIMAESEDAAKLRLPPHGIGEWRMESVED